MGEEEFEVEVDGLGFESGDRCSLQPIEKTMNIAKRRNSVRGVDAGGAEG